MASRELLKVDGAKQLRKSMKTAGADMQQMKDAHRKVAQTVTTRARGQVPVRTGRLQRTVRAGATQRAAIIRAGTKAVPYAPPIHWGWPKRNIRAQPWMYEAAVATEPTWTTQYQDAVEDILGTIEGK